MSVRPASAPAGPLGTNPPRAPRPPPGKPCPRPPPPPRPPKPPPPWPPCAPMPTGTTNKVKAKAKLRRTLFISKRLNRIKLCRFARGIVAEENAHSRRRSEEHTSELQSPVHL